MAKSSNKRPVEQINEQPLEKTYKRIFSLPRNKQPAWLKRRLDILDDLLSNPVFEDEVKRLRHFNYEKLSEEDKAKLIGQLFYKFKVPEDLYPAVMQYILEDKISLAVIHPPIEYVSHYHKLKGISPLPHTMYEIEEFKMKFDAHFNKELAIDPRLIIYVNQGTTRQELRDFIDDFFDEHLAPALKNPVAEELFWRKKVKSRKFKKRDKRILELHKDGKSSIEIMNVLVDEDYESLDASRINKIIKRLKGRIEINYDTATDAEIIHKSLLNILEKLSKKDS